MASFFRRCSFIWNLSSHCIMLLVSFSTSSVCTTGISRFTGAASYSRTAGRFPTLRTSSRSTNIVLSPARSHQGTRADTYQRGYNWALGTNRWSISFRGVFFCCYRHVALSAFFAPSYRSADIHRGY
ncbi:hypothetical protein OF83DRAFT_142507 [Amylostereum chailletii]|nr:hypothetical protein OF83DRAFT_142507 [Amylostereum chailletii]